MANALPLLLGAGALFFLMGKKGNGAASPTSVVVVEAGDTKSEIEGLFDPAAHDRVCGIFSLIDGFGPNQVADVARAAAVKYPRTFFVVVAGGPAIEQLKDWADDTTAAMVLSGTVLVMAGDDMGDEGTPAIQLGVTAATAAAKISQTIDVALAAGQVVGGGLGGPQLTGVIPASANASGGTQAFALNTGAPSAGSPGGQNCPLGQIAVWVSRPGHPPQLECKPPPIGSPDKNQGVLGAGLNAAFAVSIHESTPSA